VPLPEPVIVYRGLRSDCFVWHRDEFDEAIELGEQLAQKPISDSRDKTNQAELGERKTQEFKRSTNPHSRSSATIALSSPDLRAARVAPSKADTPRASSMLCVRKRL
jgi:hypothetical protein